ncbi:MAG TPA: hypothetical protein VGL23_14625 [Chloroflexota bacterium]
MLAIVPSFLFLAAVLGLAPLYSKGQYDRAVDRAERLAGVRARGLAAARAALDPERHLIGGPTYRPPASLPLALALLGESDPAGAREAAAIVAAVLDSQELGARHPHRGNFRWLADDPEVVDLNAVQFVLRALLPILVRHDRRLPTGLIARCRESVRLALAEEERLDVAPTYTNIHLMSLLALLVGGEWLDDDRFWTLGRERWARWVAFTVGSGAPHEYASPGYGAIDLAVLAELIGLVRDSTVRLQARLMHERLWLHLALHLHRPTGQFVGPHCRAYWGAMTSGQGPLKELLWLETGWPWLLAPGPYGGQAAEALPSSLELALTEDRLPEAVRVWLDQQAGALPCEVREIANAAEGHDLTHYLTPGYALGTASRTYGIGQDDFYIEHQANYLILHYARPAARGGWGTMYSRYVVNDQHWGTRAAAPDRSPESNFYDFGNFAGLQARNRAIGLYALKPQADQAFSLKTVVVFPAAEQLEQVWADGEPVDPATLPRPFRLGGWLVVADGAVYVGVRPLEPSCLGREAPILLERGPQGELWLTAYNYRGPAKRFWDYASLRGAFWRGNLRAGFVVEVAERSEYRSAEAFLAHLGRSTVEDAVDERQLRTVVYRSGAGELRLSYDLWRSEPGQRWIDGAPYRPSSLSSPLAVQGDGGRLAVGGASLETDPQPAWLIAQELDPARRAWIAVNPQERPTRLRLRTPNGLVSASRFGMGRLEWRAPVGGEQVLIVESREEPVGLVVPEGVRILRSAQDDN